MDELAVVMYLPRQIRVAFVGRLEDHLVRRVLAKLREGSEAAQKRKTTHLGSICELVCSEVDLSKRALPDQPAEGVVPDGLEVLRREFTVNNDR